MKNKAAKNVAHYLSLPYTITLRRDEEGDVVARVKELAGCIAHGRDEAEARDRIREMQRLWLEDCIEAGYTVPEPSSPQ